LVHAELIINLTALQALKSSMGANIKVAISVYEVRCFTAASS
jgi:hypothetical protein